MQFQPFSIFFSLLCTSVHTVDASAWFPQPSASPLHHIFAPIGEFCRFCLFEVMLTPSVVFAVVFAWIPTLCACLRVPDASEMILSFCGSFVRYPALSPGEFWGFQTLRLSDGFFQVFSSLHQHSAHRYTCPIHLNGFIGSQGCLCVVLHLWQVSLAFFSAPALLLGHNFVTSPCFNR